MRSAENIEKIVKTLELDIDTNAQTDQAVLSELLDAQTKSMKQQPAFVLPNVRRFIMKSPITKLAATVVIIIALFVGSSIFTNTPTAVAQVLAEAADAMAKLESFHIRVEMRTLPGDNFALIGLDYDFVPIDFWKQSTGDRWGKWRLEEPGRVVVMDGQRSTMLFKDLNLVHEVRDRSPERYWDECLVEIDQVTNREAKEAAKNTSEFVLYHEQGEDGRDKIVIVVEAQAKVPETDHLRNKYIKNSDHQKIYCFDAETKLLEDIQVYVHDKDRDVLVFKLVLMEYNTEPDPALFSLDLPENVIRSVSLEILPDNERYENMTPKEAATLFFNAWANEDWEEALKFMGQTDIPQLIKNHYGGLEIIEIGKPFQSANHPGWFVPYKLRLKSGEMREHNLALRKDNSANRFEYDGGF
ncbi:MAG: LolA family protein [Planctomycetota bacterium]